MDKYPLHLLIFFTVSLIPVGMFLGAIYAFVFTVLFDYGTSQFTKYKTLN